jgi:hypothetical protein
VRTKAVIRLRARISFTTLSRHYKTFHRLAPTQGGKTHVHSVTHGLSSRAEYNEISFDPACKNEPLARLRADGDARVLAKLWVLPSGNSALTRAR